MHVNKESAHDAEAKAAKQRELIPYETRVQQFRDMLVEKEVGISPTAAKHVFLFIQVSAFTTWEQEMNKIVSDSRYSLLNAKERKQEFDRYTHGLPPFYIDQRMK